MKKQVKVRCEKQQVYCLITILAQVLDILKYLYSQEFTFECLCLSGITTFFSACVCFKNFPVIELICQVKLKKSVLHEMLYKALAINLCP